MYIVGYLVHHGGVTASSKHPLIHNARHIADGGAPILGFLVGDHVAGVRGGVLVALAIAAALTAVRLLRRDSPRTVFAAVAVVLVFSISAALTGEGRGFFLPSLVFNSVIAVGFGASVLIGTPLSLQVARYFGYEPSDTADADRRRALHRRISLAWAGYGALHVAIMFPLYLADNTVALGTIAVFVNKPGMAAMLALTAVWIRRARPAEPATPR
ncbi:DUF3159 domain-containing protein [Nocardia cyriacigeorgica]|nr:DUF3159 domain-containing protein [Nocardia cyriacigeorgica]PPJ08925.1 DUF3159 domain-containing protein [Nocardia cyriacigeorgica]TLF59845.1 DUF3159 domain-containing protein [Nocardia cyriacigeorgica]